jgi:uncharacterized protein (TIGR02246 family)
MTSRCNTRPTAVFCACLASLLFAASCGQPAPVDTRAADEKAIRDLDAQWSRTAAANDLEGTVSFYTDDATLLPPNAPIAIGKQAIRASWASLLGPGVAVSWQVKSVEVARSGDLAYLIGAYDLTMKDPQGMPVSDRGKLLEVWEKQPDGKWKAVADTYNSDLPPSPPPPAKKK